MASDWQQALDSIVARLEPEIVALRRHLHANPEPSGAELQTSLNLYQRLGEAGLTVRMGPGPALETYRSDPEINALLDQIYDA